MQHGLIIKPGDGVIPFNSETVTDARHVPVSPLQRNPTPREGQKAMRHRCGDKVCFHGAFTSKSKAQAKASKVKGTVKGIRYGRGDYRYLVTTPKK
jgi:hypothetical protein